MTSIDGPCRLADGVCMARVHVCVLQRIDWRSSDLDVERCRLKQKSKVERVQSTELYSSFRDDIYSRLSL